MRHLCSATAASRTRLPNSKASSAVSLTKFFSAIWCDVEEFAIRSPQFLHVRLKLPVQFMPADHIHMLREILMTSGYFIQHGLITLGRLYFFTQAVQRFDLCFTGKRHPDRLTR